MGNHSTEKNICLRKKNQMEILAIKNTISEVNLLDELNRRLEMKEQSQ